MQVLKIGDVANSARNSRNAVCGMDDKFESIIRRHFRRGWEEVRGCWSKMITSYNYTKSLTTKSPRRTSIAATQSMVWQYFSVVCTNMYVVLCRLMRRSGTNQNPPPRGTFSMGSGGEGPVDATGGRKPSKRKRFDWFDDSKNKNK